MFAIIFMKFSIPRYLSHNAVMTTKLKTDKTKVFFVIPFKERKFFRNFKFVINLRNENS